jgi:tryptophan halogenase
MKIGYREEFWHKNCIALGLAQGFLEPLEATSILLTDFAANFLCQRFPSTKEELPVLAKRFNHAMGHAWSRVVDFIKLHYCLSDRQDSTFWIENRNPSTIPVSLQEKLAMWENFTPISDDFFSQFEVFYLENFLFVLYGMKFKTKINPSDIEDSTQRLSALKEITKNLVVTLPEHRELLEKINKFGLQEF